MTQFNVGDVVVYNPRNYPAHAVTHSIASARCVVMGIPNKVAIRIKVISSDDAYIVGNNYTDDSMWWQLEKERQKTIWDD